MRHMFMNIMMIKEGRLLTMRQVTAMAAAPKVAACCCSRSRASR